MPTRGRAYTAFLGLAWGVLSIAGVTACASSKQATEYTPQVCSEKNVAVVFRLDYLTLELKGFSVLTPEGEPLAAEDAAAAALQAFAPLAGGHMAEAYRGMEEWEDNPFELRLETPAGSDVYAAMYPPGDFGGAVLLDALTGEALFVGETVWAGDGEILYPADWSGPESLEFLDKRAEEPASLTVVDSWTGESCCKGLEDECIEVPCTTGEDAFAAVRKGRLLHDIAACGPYNVLSFMYARGVGMTNWDTAEWVVVVTGTAPEPVLAGRYDPEPVGAGCTESLPTPANPPQLIAAYKVCPSGVWADDAQFFIGEFGEWWGAYLYSDGTLLYRNPNDGLPWFLMTQLDSQDWCGILTDVDPAGLQDEAATGEIAITEAIDVPHSFVFFRDEAMPLNVRLYGDLWDGNDLLPDYSTLAPNAVALATGLRGFEGVTGKPYGAEQMALWAWAAGEAGFPDSCPADSPEWPFPELALAPFAAEYPFLEPPIATLDAETTKVVRTWWLETDGPESGNGACVKQNGTLFRVYLLDLLPGGYDAVPMPSCRSTAV